MEWRVGTCLARFADMDVRNRYTETLSCAAATMGGSDRLAQFLNVSRKRLNRWLAGEEALPNQVFLDALDVIADGPYASPERRRARVAVLATEPPRR
jgi:hypothetical protein